MISVVSVVSGKETRNSNLNIAHSAYPYLQGYGYSQRQPAPGRQDTRGEYHTSHLFKET